jgi:hypothetical protein
MSGSLEVRAELFRFTLMTMPHADDAPSATPRGPSEYDKPIVEPPSGDEARLAIILTIVRASEVGAFKDLSSSLQVEATLIKRLLPLRRIACDSHD